MNAAITMRKCVECNSEDDGFYCLYDANKLKYCNSVSGQCYTYSENGTLRRGCVGDDVINSIRKCHASSDECSICSNGDLCNDRYIVQGSCYWLTPGSNKTPESRNCPITIRSNGCYTRVNQTTHETEMGCMTNLSREDRKLCKENGSECKVCFDDNCNQRDYLMECIDCDSDSDLSCWTPDVNTTTRQCYDLTTPCYTHVYENRIRRGCSGDGFPINCANDPNCLECSDGLCNIDAIMNTCLMCNSRTDPNCRDNPDVTKRKICSMKHPLESKENACYTEIYLTALVRRGCVNDLTWQEMDRCHESNENCQTCMGTDCNKRNFQMSCYSCSRHEDCTIFQEDMKTVTCHDYSSTCLTGIDSDGYTYRGCSTNKENDGERFRLGYELCDDEKCNNNTFPAKRLHCYTCDPTSECDFEPGYNSSRFLAPCDFYDEQDKCFAFAYPGI